MNDVHEITEMINHAAFSNGYNMVSDHGLIMTFTNINTGDSVDILSPEFLDIHSAAATIEHFEKTPH